MLNKFRELTSAEIDFVYGGDGETIVVTGMRPQPSGGVSGTSGGSGNGWGQGSDSDAASSNPDTNGSGGNHPGYGADTSCIAAMAIADAIKGTGSHPNGPVPYDFNSAEYSASIIQGTDGRFYTGTTDIYSDGNLGSVRNQSTELSAGQSYIGYIHNHPDEAGDNTFDRINRYPSSGDWAVLASEAAKFGAANPSLWIIDARGDVREYKLSDRARVEAISQFDKDDGVGLPAAMPQSGC